MHERFGAVQQSSRRCEKLRTPPQRRAAPVDLINLTAIQPVDFMGMRVEVGGKLLPRTSVEYKTYREASPLYHVSRDSAPFLLMHGDANKVVPFKNAEAMELALKQAGVEVKLLRIVGGDHGADFPGAKNPPDYLGEMVRWFDQHLQSTANH